MGKQDENHALSVAAVLGGIVRSCDPVSVVSKRCLLGAEGRISVRT